MIGYTASTMELKHFQGPTVEDFRMTHIILFYSFFFHICVVIPGGNIWVTLEQLESHQGPQLKLAAVS